MSRNIIDSTARAKKTQQQLEKELNAICAMIDDKHFAKEKIDELRKKIRQQCQFGATANLGKIDEFLLAAKEEIIEYRKAYKQHSNVVRQEAEVAKSINDAGKISIEKMSRAAQERMGVGPDGIGWLSEEDEFGVEEDLFSRRNSTRQNIDLIKSRTQPVLHASPHRSPFKSAFGRTYRELLSQARQETAHDVLSRSRRLRTIIDNGAPTSVPFKPYKESAVKTTLVDRPTKFIAAQTQKAFNWAGRGIFSSSKPEYSPEFTRYMQRRNAAISNFSHKLNPNDTAQAELVKRYQELLDGVDFLDEASFDSLLNLFKKEIEGANKVNADQMKKVDEKLEEIRKEMFATAKEHSKDEDEMWKLRVLQAFLIASPFIGIAALDLILGPVSSALGAGGLANGLASIFSPEVIGPLGYVTEFLRLGDLVELILKNVPILKDLVGLTDSIIGSNIAQSVLSTVALPFLSGPIVPIGIAALYSVYRISSEVDHANKYSDAFKAHDKKLEETTWDLIKNLKDAEDIKLDQCKTAVDAAIKKSGLKPADAANLKSQLRNLMQQHLSDAEIEANKKKAQKIISDLPLDAAKKGALKNEVASAFDGFFEGPNFDAFVDKKFEIFRKFYEIESLVDFSARAFESKVNGENSFRIIAGKDIWDKLIEADVVCEGDSELSQKSITALRKFLGNNADLNQKVRTELEQKIMLFCHFAKEPSFDAIMAKVNDNMDEIAKNGPRAAALQLIAEEKAFRDQEFIIEVARERGIDTSAYKHLVHDPNNPIDHAERKKEVDRLEKIIKAREVAFMKESVKKRGGIADKDAIKRNSGIPPTNIALRSATSMQLGLNRDGEQVSCA